MSAEKCVLVSSTRLVFLGTVFDSVLRRFEVAEDTLAKVEDILSEAIRTTCVAFTMREKLAAKCTRV